MALFVGRERRQGKQFENKECHFVEVAKGKYARTRVCLRMKTTDLKCFTSTGNVGEVGGGVEGGSKLQFQFYKG